MEDMRVVMEMCSIGKKLRTLIVDEIGDGTEIMATIEIEDGDEKME